ncbi:hypothetical protein GJV85_00235 [Sulfurimonas aquatica]|uniref:Outer membrane protein beta-barrel domain-containing protein n=1 Tax=Sulfurimonas aquatica TaxID=2672570 RepID=A0A975AXX6_9BACT|nr:hypothetical protein [Sulfurimonas aquatica]QSZ40609.1 hypothetical protein GJV85_00235 [Sulfurimonas aquatica]
MKFFVVFILFLSLLFSADNYILVTKATKKAHLNSIYSKLKRVGEKMLYIKNSRSYIIYTGPYGNALSSKKALSRIRYYFPHAKISMRKQEQKSDVLQQKVKNKKTDSENSSQLFYTNNHKSGSFIKFGTGFSSAVSTHSIESGTVKINEPNSNGISYTLGAGYNFKNGFFISTNYMHLNTDDIAFDNIYASLNYKFENIKKFTPYFGLMSGYSRLGWSVGPIDSVDPVSNNNSDSLFFGTLAGVLYESTENFSYFINYDCLFMQHTTNIDNSTATSINISSLKHNTLHSLKLGIQYNF